MSMLLLLACAAPVSEWTPLSAGASWPDEAGAAWPVPVSLAALTWLADVSHYGQVGVRDGWADAGTWGIGNGVVFALLGPASPANTLTNLIGPGYQASDGFFGDSALILLQDSSALPITDEGVQRPRGSSVVRTWTQSGALSWSTVDFAVPDAAVLGRLVTVRNEGEPADGLRLRLSLEGEHLADGDGLIQTRGAKTLRLSCAGAVAGAEGLEVALPLLDAGAEIDVPCWYSFGDDPPTTDLPTLLQAARDVDQEFLASALSLELPDSKVMDLYEGLLLTLHTQTAATGIVSPMHRYTSAWLRDGEGPVRFYLQAGLFSQARAQLDGVYQLSVMNGSIANSMPLPDAWGEWTEPDDPEAFWAAAPFMSGRNAAEAPSYPVLHHLIYAGRSGDDAILDDARRAFLQACVARQDITDGRLPFSGDETYGLALAGATGVGLPAETGWSAQSGFLYVAAAEGLAAWTGDAAEAAEVRAATEKTFNQGFYSPFAAFDTLTLHDAPFEDVSLHPLWDGYGAPDDPAQAENARATLDALLRDDGTLLSRAAGSELDNFGYTGMVPAFFLHTAAALHLPEEPVAFAALDFVATPSGHFEEMHAADNRPLFLVHDPTGLSADSPARYRPWEGGDAGAALLSYLLGVPLDGSVQFAPHLPDGWPSLAAYGIRIGETTFDLSLQGFVEGQQLTLTQQTGEGTTATVTLHGAAPIVRVVVDGADWPMLPGEVVMVTGVPLSAGEPVTIVAVYGPGG